MRLPLTDLIFELYYPVGLASELGPDLHAIHSISVDRLPSWTHRLLAEFHERLASLPDPSMKSVHRASHGLQGKFVTMGLSVRQINGTKESPLRRTIHNPESLTRRFS
jgi:hypothetical protein